MHSFWQDLRIAVRTLSKERGFTALAVLTLAIGVGANTAMFSTLNAVLIAPLPYDAPERLVIANTTFEGYLNWTSSAQDYEDHRQQNEHRCRQKLKNLIGYEDWIGLNLLAFLR